MIATNTSFKEIKNQDEKNIITCGQHDVIEYNLFRNDYRKKYCRVKCS